MSSSASTTSFSSPTDTGGGESTGGTPRGANYFFGFLITFVGLLIIFIICGIGSRRRLARRRGLNEALEPLERFRKLEGGETRPEFYEPPLVVGGDRWSSLMVRTKNLDLRHQWSLPFEVSSRYLLNSAERKRAIQLIMTCNRHYRQPRPHPQIPDITFSLHSIGSTTTEILPWKVRPILNHHQTLCKSLSWLLCLGIWVLISKNARTVYRSTRLARLVFHGARITHIQIHSRWTPLFMFFYLDYGLWDIVVLNYVLYYHTCTTKRERERARLGDWRTLIRGQARRSAPRQMPSAAPNLGYLPGRLRHCSGSEVTVITSSFKNSVCVMK